MLPHAWTACEPKVYHYQVWSTLFDLYILTLLAVLLSPSQICLLLDIREAYGFFLTLCLLDLQTTPSLAHSIYLSTNQPTNQSSTHSRVSIPLSEGYSLISGQCSRGVPPSHTIRFDIRDDLSDKQQDDQRDQRQGVWDSGSRGRVT